MRVLDLTGAEIRDIQAEAVELPIGQSVHKVGWSPDGQLLTVSTMVRLNVLKFVSTFFKLCMYISIPLALVTIALSLSLP